MRRPESLAIIKQALLKVAPSARVLLYGSEARGEAREDSDFDLLILEEADEISYNRRLEIVSPLYDLLWQKGINVSPMVMTKQQWENRPFVTPFFLNVMQDGIEI